MNIQLPRTVIIELLLALSGFIASAIILYSMYGMSFTDHNEAIRYFRYFSDTLNPFVVAGLAALPLFIVNILARKRAFWVWRLLLIFVVFLFLMIIGQSI